jgi:HK97 family phage prohead protease
MSARELTRSLPFQVRAEGDEPGDGLTLEGIAAVFATPTRIDSWEGVFDEQIRRGAFRKTIRDRTPVLQFEHGRHPLIGSIPIGSISDLREDDDGLFVSARLTDNWLIQPIRDAIADGAVDGMSFRFEVVREEWRDNTGKLLKDDTEILQLLYRPDDRGPLQRTLVELKVPELGPVVFPAYRETTVGVRARSIATTAIGDDDFVHQIRASLARSVEAVPADLDDPELRRDVARALLLDAPPAGHPSTDETPRTEDAPPAGHPSEDTDAPPADGHPSMSQRLMDAHVARIAGLAEASRRYIDKSELRSADHG